VGVPTIEVSAAGESADPVADIQALEQIIKDVSKTGQKKAGLLLDHLKKSKMLTWNTERGNQFSRTEDTRFQYRGFDQRILETKAIEAS
jgi:hypothetical protein